LYFTILIEGKSKATWLMIAFFGCMALLGCARILEGTVGGQLFILAQDAFIVLAGLLLVEFAYHFPQYDQPREERIALIIYALITLLTLGTILILAILNFSSPKAFIAAPEYYWYLMPLAIVIAIIICLRRAMYYGSQEKQSKAGWRNRLSNSFGMLIHPPNNSAAAQRNLALAISLGVIQAIPSMGIISPGLLGIFMIGIGGLLVVGGIALVYYSHSLEPVSFRAKLIGIALTGLLIFAGISGISSIQTAVIAQEQQYTSQFRSVQETIVNHGDPHQPPSSQVRYILSWPAPTDYQLTDLSIHFLGENVSADSLNSIQGLGGPESGLKLGFSQRFVYNHFSDFYRFRFLHDGRVYEVGFPWAAFAKPVLEEINLHIFLTVVGSLLVLIIFPFFFRRHLFGPLDNLLQGVRQADEGSLQIQVPVKYEDEIGSITHSFNQMVASLHESKNIQAAYLEELELAREELEQRVIERTQELIEVNKQLQFSMETAEETAVLAERQRLARDLHDAITQSLYGVMLFARASRDAQEAGEIAKLTETLEEIEINSLQTLKEMRLLLHQLRPSSLDRGGLAQAISRRFDQVERRLGITTTADINKNLDLSRRKEESLYMIATEALNNSLKHGNAREVRVCIDQINGDVQLIVEDNGQGFDKTQPTAGMGLKNMRERANLAGGDIEIWTEGGNGTRINVTIPQSAESK
ncbi:MAG: HAMP domain-containing protein, partial [Anaerolineaceae bacterium]